MSESLSNFRTRVNAWSRVPQGASLVLTESQLDFAIHAAVRDYSSVSGVRKTVQLTGDGPSYSLPGLVTGWVRGWSIVNVLSERWDPISGGNVLHPIDSNRWRVYMDGTTEYLWTRAQEPWLEYLYPHTVAASANDTTVPAIDLDLVARLAASYAIRMHGAESADTNSSLLLGDSVSYNGITNQLNEVAAKYAEDFEKWTKARYAGKCAGLAEWDLRNSTGRMLFHRSDRW